MDACHDADIPSGPIALNHLVVTADDFGLHTDVNEAVEIAHRFGILSAASLMVVGPAAADAVRRARRLPRLRVGLHLALVDACSLLPPSAIPDLVDASDRLRTDLFRVGIDMLRPALRRQIVAEIAAQFEAYRASGLALDHVNAHRHFHLHPIVAKIIMGFSRQYGVGALRVPLEPTTLLGRLEPGPRWWSPLFRLWSLLLRNQAVRNQLLVPDAVFGMAWSGAMTRTRLLALLRALPPGLIEMYLHPATSNAFAGSAAGYRYTEELAALTDRSCMEALVQAHHTLGGYADARNKASAGRKDLNAPAQTAERPDQEQGRDRFSNQDATATRSAASHERTRMKFKRNLL
jgi:chitin disaccharide deacetylase